jgi:hypothetical protein
LTCALLCGVGAGFFQETKHLGSVLGIYAEDSWSMRITKFARSSGFIFIAAILFLIVAYGALSNQLLVGPIPANMTGAYVVRFGLGFLLLISASYVTSALRCAPMQNDGLERVVGAGQGSPRPVTWNQVVLEHVSTDAQRTYNWLYHRLKGLETSLPSLFRLSTMGSHRSTAPLRVFASALGIYAKAARVLANETSLSLYDSVALELDRFQKEVSSACSRYEEGNLDAYSQEMVEAAAHLHEIRIQLDADSPIRYHHWLKNPWRYWPKKPT